MTVNYRKFKSYSLFSSLILSATVLIGWSQPWFVLKVTFPTENPAGLEISGQTAAPGLSALGLSGFAITAALSLSSVLIRRILSVLFVALGISVVLISVSSWTDPVVAASAQITSLSAISDLETLRSFVISSSATAWPGISAVSGILFIPLGTVIFFTAGKWGTASRKFDRVANNSDESQIRTSNDKPTEQKTDPSSSNIDAWDSLSHGTDPTIN
jgi:uncharacterized membrane protein (TIGR02234 family)